MSLSLFLLILFSYALGSVPFGLLLGRLFADVDIRNLGSGNIGATNINRILGKKLGAATLLCDVGKAVFPVFLAQAFFQSDFISSCVGAAAILGHCFPIYLKMKGGKGVASTFGVVLMVSPYAALVLLVSWFLAYRFSKISAVGALVATAIMPVAVFFETGIYSALVFSFIAVLIVWRHKENIERLRSGTELPSTNEKKN